MVIVPMDCYSPAVWSRAGQITSLILGVLLDPWVLGSVFHLLSQISRNSLPISSWCTSAWKELLSMNMFFKLMCISTVRWLFKKMQKVSWFTQIHDHSLHAFFHCLSSQTSLKHQKYYFSIKSLEKSIWKVLKFTRVLGKEHRWFTEEIQMYKRERNSSSLVRE